MLKAILMLDCNICGQLFDGVVTTTETEPMNLKALSLDLEYEAENRGGWSFHRGTHHCANCVTDAALSNRQKPENSQREKREG
jgi:hypothetical protein